MAAILSQPQCVKMVLGSHISKYCTRHDNGKKRKFECEFPSAISIDRLHKSHNASVLYPTMHHFVTEMCTCVHISVTKRCMMGYLSSALWDL